VTCATPAHCTSSCGLRNKKGDLEFDQKWYWQACMLFMVDDSCCLCWCAVSASVRLRPVLSLSLPDLFLHKRDTGAHAKHGRNTHRGLFGAAVAVCSSGHDRCSGGALRKRISHQCITNTSQSDTNEGKIPPKRDLRWFECRSIHFYR
jgi:hypothetical protein